MNLNRLTSDGDLLILRKTGTPVGSIGTKTGSLYMGTGDAGIGFNHHGSGNLDSIMPYSITAGAFQNGAVDIGGSVNKFKDIHLSGIANVPQLNLVNSAATQCLNVSRAGGGAVTNGATIVSGAIAKFNGNVAGSDSLRIGSFDNGTGAHYIDVSNYNGTGAYDLVLNPYVGNVGVRAPDPATALHVAGNSSTRNSIVSTLTIDGGVNVGNPYDGFGFGIDFIGRDYGNAVRNYAAIYSVMENQVSSSGGGDAGFKTGLRFYTNGGGASNTSTTERMRIDNLGAVKMTKGGTAFTPLLYDGLVIQSHDATGIRIIDAGNGGSNGGHCGIGNDNGHLQLSTAGDMMFDTGFEPTDQLYNGRHEKMRIHSEGYITTPSQPAFDVHHSGGSYASGSTVTSLDLNTVRLNRGNHYSASNDRFIAPVAGVYVFYYRTIISGAYSNLHVRFRANGSVIPGGDTHTSPPTAGVWSQISSQILVQLAVNDYVQVEHTSNTNIYGDSYQTFQGHLLG
jgi:hypothetical protein